MVHWSDIEKVLDDLISNEEGMKLQGLAVILAKQKWQDLIACASYRSPGRGICKVGRRRKHLFGGPKPLLTFHPRLDDVREKEGTEHELA